VAVETGGTIDYDLEHTYDTDVDSDSVAYTNSTIDGSTASDETSYVAPIAGVRVRVNSHTSGTLTIRVLQVE